VRFINRRKFLKTLAAFGAASQLPSGCSSFISGKSGKSKPNIVFIVADDMGWGDIGYHNSEIRSPNLDKLARTGIELNRHYVQPQCTPTRVALMTGRYPSRFGEHCTQACNEHAYPFETLTMASMLGESGYTTGCFGKWHMGSLPRWGPNFHGFDYSYGSLAGAVGMHDHRYRIGSEYETTWHRNHEYISEEGHATDLVTAEAIQWIGKQAAGGKPFFCYVPYHSVHVPLVEEDKWLRMNSHIEWEDRRLMAAAVSHLDGCVGKIVKTLERLSLRENTLLVFVSDNGGLNWGHPGNAYPPPDVPLGPEFSSNKPLRAGKCDVYEGGIRVPAFVNWPGKLKPAKNETVSHAVDWMPTIAALTGCSVSAEELKWDGMDIWPYITGKKDMSSERQLYWVWAPNRRKVAIRAGDWKLLRNNTNDDWHLFNIADDPYEQNDLAEKLPEKVQELKQLIREEKKKDNLKSMNY
jgi:arylsulfatase A-like enzyme